MNGDSHRAFYSEEASTYEASRYGSRYGRLFRILQHAAVGKELPRSSLVLDVAAGTGQLLPVLAMKSDIVVASDLTPAMLAEARRRCEGISQVAYCVGDANRLPYADGAFGVVTSSRFLHLFPPEKQALLVQEMARVLRPGGTLIVDFYSADARRLLAVPIVIYRALRRRRPENDYRVSIGHAVAMIQRAELKITRVEGIGNYLLILGMWLPLGWQIRLGQWFGRHAKRMSEQFLIAARKP